MSVLPCPSCHGKRLKPESLAVTINDKSIYDVTTFSIKQAKDFFDALKLDETHRKIAHQILKEVRSRLTFMTNVGLDYFTSPYDFDSVDQADPYVDIYKIGSGDITWLEIIEYIAHKGKPVMIATGASEMKDVMQAMEVLQSFTNDIVLMQCNTNYTASPENYDHINLKVLKTYANLFPNIILGLSDHTHAVATVLGAITLGARVIERHFTDDNNRIGPDHKFAMDPIAWSNMVKETRLLERALGSGDKYVCDNETDTVVVQRRCLRSARDIAAGEVLTRDMIDVLRPATPGAILPPFIEQVVGTRALRDITFGEELRWTDLGI